MSHQPLNLQPGDIRRLHHVGVPYDAHGMLNARWEPKVFQRLRAFWKSLGMHCEALFAEESPDRGGRGWRLYVGSVRDPVQIVYRPVPTPIVLGWLLRLIVLGWLLHLVRHHTVHFCLDVAPETFLRLREHPNREREATWGPHHGLSSVLIKGPLGEEIEFTCSSTRELTVFPPD